MCVCVIQLITDAMKICIHSIICKSTILQIFRFFFLYKNKMFTKQSLKMRKEHLGA